MTLKASLRDSLFDVVGAAACVFPLSLATQGFFRRRCPIVFYHAIWKAGDPRLELFGGVPLDVFRADLRTIGRLFDFVSLSDMIGGPIGGAKPAAAITFDDGFDLVAGGAADALEEVGARATVFVNGDSLSYDRVLWQHAFGVVKAMRGEPEFVRAFNEAQRRRGLGRDIARFDDFIEATQRWPQDLVNPVTDEIWASCRMPPMAEFLREHRPYLDVEGLRAWQARGHSIGFHGQSHLWSRALDESGAQREYVTPARLLGESLGLGPIAFAYPFGDRLAQEAPLADSGAFSCILGTDRLARRGENPFAIDRIEADFGLVRHFIGRPIVRALRGQDRRPHTAGA